MDYVNQSGLLALIGLPQGCGEISHACLLEVLLHVCLGYYFMLVGGTTCLLGDTTTCLLGVQLHVCWGYYYIYGIGMYIYLLL